MREDIFLTAHLSPCTVHGIEDKRSVGSSSKEGVWHHLVHGEQWLVTTEHGVVVAIVAPTGLVDIDGIQLTQALQGWN